MTRAPWAVAAAVLTTLATTATRARADEATDEIIDDGPTVLQVATPATTRAKTPSALYTRGATRFTGFLQDGDANADRFESRTFLFVGAKSNDGDDDPWRVEVRADLLARSKDHPEDAGAQAWDLEARPWELWWRTRVASATTLTLGYQPLAWGVLDVGAAADPFATYDLRLGPALTPAEVRLPVPAARVTWSPSARIDVDFAYLPFFTPHRFDVLGTRYATVSAATLGSVARAFDAGTLTRITAPIATANGVDARPDHGELGLRNTVHFTAFDLALTAAFARNRFPSFRVTEAFATAVNTGSAAALLRAQQELDAGVRPLEAVHARYVQLAIDAQGSLGSVPWGAELGVSSKRELLAANALTAIDTPRAYVLQGGLRASTTFGDLLLTAQGAVYTLLDASRPEAVIPVTPVVFGAARTALVGLTSARYEAGAWAFEASGLGLCAGPETSARACDSATLLATGRVAYGTDEVTVSVGGTVLASPSGATLPTRQAIDQLALRVDWTPSTR